ncbi:hypothetical protein RN001_002470 [Aquatica leii]|uniref:Uncharacterized protein n=1 Tax=Aquatica leii TaxID=1421715 RepID=A0AAN7SLU7_9COLE|nr:hypothetical protein RN001_002470 [Aquatica leii]
MVEIIFEVVFQEYKASKAEMEAFSNIRMTGIRCSPETMEHPIIKSTPACEGSEPCPSVRVPDQSSNGAGPENVIEEPIAQERIIRPNVKTGKGVLVPSRQRKREPLRKNALSYLTEKAQRESHIKLKELDLEERKIALQERQMNLEVQRLQMDKEKLALEIEERREKLELQKQQLEIIVKDKEVTNNIIQAQQQLIDSLLKKLIICTYIYIYIFSLFSVIYNVKLVQKNTLFYF